MRIITCGALGAASIAVLSLLTACTPAAEPIVSNAPSSSLPAASLPTFDPSRGAQGNLALFSGTIRTALKKGGWLTSTTVVGKALVAAGFDRKGIEISPDYTSLGMKPDSISVAAKFEKKCLIGQYGPAFKDVAVSVAPVLPNGGCLLGRSIEHL